jgi:uncharacterized membrane protein YedE/YeeE
MTDKTDKTVKTSAWLTTTIAALSGLVFGAGLVISEMVSPQRVLGFLDVAGQWDPTLVLVMAGALLVSFPAFQLARKMAKPVCELKFSLPTRTDVDSKLLGGSAVFGGGWGLAGFCPGPALVGLSTFNPAILVFVLCMLFGMLLYQVLMD